MMAPRRARDRARLLFASLLLSQLYPATAITFQSVSSPPFDISSLGRVALVGNFDSLSLYNYVGQDEDGLHTNGSQSLLGRYPTGALTNLASSDAYIEAMCPFTTKTGTLQGVVVGGNFTSIGSQPAQALALFNPTDQQITPLPGLTGRVSSLYCDNSMETVYIAGSFTAGNSTNAIAWTTGWTNLPFSGFNGPVNAIARRSNGNIVFGGSFTGIGNSTRQTTTNSTQIAQQVVNVGSANITAVATATVEGYTDPRNIICTTPDQAGPGHEWLLQDNTPGQWQANFGFGFVPTKLRLYNAQKQDYGTKTWHYIAGPINGIMNFTYYMDGSLQSCTLNCPLAQNSSYQDFYFVNPVGMNGFTISITDWYGRAGGLAGVELLQNDIYSFAISEYNEPTCDGISTGSSATQTGNWTYTPAGQSSSPYLSATLPNGTVGTNETGLSVVFKPNIVQSGNYSVTVYTPGCLSDNTCTQRGEVSITGQMSSGSSSATSPISSQLFQTNNYDKYDQVYFGYVEANSDSFRPTVTLTPSPDQQGPLDIVAQRVRFELVSSIEGLNGLFEYNPNNSTITSADFSISPIDKAGTQLNNGANILALENNGDTLYAAGKFTSDSFTNIMAISAGNATSLPGGGLNDAVDTLFMDGSSLYAGGNFTNTRDNSVTGLNNVAYFSTSDNAWHALGAGVNGLVTSIVPLSLNFTSGRMEQCIVVSGQFDSVNGFNDYPQVTVLNTAIWVPSSNNWVYNLDSATISLSGRMDAYTTVPGMEPIYAGSVDSQELSATSVSGLQDTSPLSLQQIPVKITPQKSTTSTLNTRAPATSQITGTVTGLFFENNGLNITILAGRMTAEATNGSTVQNLIFVNETNPSQTVVTGLANNASSDASILTLDAYGTTLFAGGSISSGILAYDLANAQLAQNQPPAISGGSNVVNTLATRPNTPDIYIGGSFTSAGALPCTALCIYNAVSQNYILPGTGILESSSVTMLQWASNTKLILSGDMTIANNKTGFVSYDPTSQIYESYPGSGDTSNVPGPIDTFTATDNSYSSFFCAGVATSNRSVFLTHYNGDTQMWTGVSGLGSRTAIYGLQVLGLTSDSHSSNNYLNSNQILIIMGEIELPSFGNVSAATFDGQKFTPFVLSTFADGTPGSVRAAFVQNPQNLLSTSSGSYLALGFIVLIGLAIALALVFLIVVVGILVERIRRRRQGYAIAPTSPHMGLRSETTKLPGRQLFAGIMPGGGNGGEGPQMAVYL